MARAQGLNMSPPTPLYQALARDLRDAITAGRYEPGDLLPTELDLCATQGVSRHTARDALRLLQSEGLIARRRGAGTVVLRSSPAGPFAQTWGGIDHILAYARDARLSIERIGPASLDLRTRLGLDPEETWRCVTGIRLADQGGLPLAQTRICVQAALLPPREALEGWTGALAELIEQRGGPQVARVRQEIAAVDLSRDEARALRVPGGSAALRTVRHYLDAAGRVFQASLSLHPGDRFTYAMEVDR